VEDTGSGIKEEDIPHLFEAFSQMDVKKHRGIQGTGLGLAITHKLSELMEGSVVLKSEYGKGSIFTCTIPQIVEADEPLVPLSKGQEIKVVLFAEEMTRDSIETMLGKLGVSVRNANNLDELSEILDHGHDSYTHLIYRYEMARELEIRVPKARSLRRIAIKSLRHADGIEDPAVAVLLDPVLVTALSRVLDAALFQRENERLETDKLNSFYAPTASVLVVDDNEINLLVASELLKQYKIDADTAQSGPEAIRLSNVKQYDLIFMDHMMPGLDGIETTERLRAIGGWRACVPIVALTANAISGMKELFLSKGMNDYVSKPIALDELNKVLRTWLPPRTLLDQTPSP
jgi:CheY-like chemotaxis protein